MTDGRCDLALIVVTYNSRDSLASFAQGVVQAAEGIEARIVVVDNASRDGTAQAAASLLPEADVVATGRNGGFAAGINAGVAHVRDTGDAAAYVVANPDVTLRPGCLTRLARALHDPAIGIAAPKLIDEHGNLQPSLRAAPSAARTWCDALLGGPRASSLGLPTEVLRGPQHYAGEPPAGGRGAVWATGGLLAISKTCWDIVGPWEESYFMYDEEVDFCLRARAAGFALRYVPDAEAVRYVGTEPMRLWVAAIMRRNRVVLARRFLGRRRAFLVWSGLAVGDLLRAARGRPEARAGLWALLRRPTPARIMARYGA